MEKTNEKYLQGAWNDFMLTTVVSQRVKELRAGATPLIETRSKSPVEIAFEEIKRGKIQIKRDDNEKDTEV